MDSSPAHRDPKQAHRLSLQTGQTAHCQYLHLTTIDALLFTIMNRATFVAAASGCFLSAHSHTTATRHPSAFRLATLTSSRTRFREILPLQKSVRVDGKRK